MWGRSETATDASPVREAERFARSGVALNTRLEGTQPPANVSDTNRDTDRVYIDTQ